MKQVSEAYKNSMAQPMRNRSFVKVTFFNVNTEAAFDSDWQDTGHMPWSNNDTLAYDYEYGRTYATAEHNRWLLDGSQNILPNSGALPDGYISNDLSDGEGGVPSNPTYLELEFSKPFMIPALTIVFDTRTGAFTGRMRVYYYLNGAVLSDDYVDVEGTTVVLTAPIAAADKIRVLFAADNLPLRRMRIERILLGKQIIFDGEKLTSVDTSTDVDPITRRLPQEKLTFTILDFEHEYDADNPSGMYTFIDGKSPIAVKYGYDTGENVEWLKDDRYVLSGRPTAKDGMATFSATGLLGGMTGLYYKDVIGTKTLYDMAVSVLEDAGLPPTSEGLIPWDVDDSLQLMTTTAVLPIDTHANCLQLIAHAARCRLYTDDSNIIHIKPFEIVVPNTAGFTLDFDSVTKGTLVASKIEPLRAVQVAKYSYSVSTNTETLYQGVTTDTELHVELGQLAQNIQVSVSGGNLVSANIYGRAVNITLSAGTKTVTITGKPLTESNVVLTYPVGIEGEIDKEENPLITSDDMALALAQHVANYLQLRNTYDAEYRGNPELEVGDIIDFQTPFTDKISAMVITDEISFNGSLHGKVKVKAL